MCCGPRDAFSLPLEPLYPPGQPTWLALENDLTEAAMVLKLGIYNCCPVLCSGQVLRAPWRLIFSGLGRHNSLCSAQGLQM